MESDALEPPMLARADADSPSVPISVDASSTASADPSPPLSVHTGPSGAATRESASAVTETKTAVTDRGERPSTEPESGEGVSREDKLDRFSCHICLEVPDEPVVTPCGHLHCWPCMHEWLVTSRGRACPVCKAVLTVEQLVPIYTSAEAIDPRSRPIPPRPRPAAPPSSAPYFRAPAFRNPFASLDPGSEIEAITSGRGSGTSSFSFQAGVFPLPGLSFGWSWPPTPAAVALPAAAEELDAETTGGRGGRVGVMMRDPHGAARTPTRDEWFRAVVQQVFMALFFAMFIAITFGG